MYPLLRLSLIMVFICTSLANVTPGIFQESITSQQYDTMNTFPYGTAAAPNATRTSPYNAPQKTDSIFVADDGGDLDQYLFRENRPDGRLKFTIPIDRYYSSWIDDNAVDQGFLKSDVRERLYNAHLLPRRATLNLMVFDVDHEATVCPEVDHIFVNGRRVQGASGAVPATLSSGNDTWSNWAISIPTEMLKFPTAPGQPAANNGRPLSVDQEIAIAINVNNCLHPEDPNRTAWAVAVDWGTISIESPIRPIIFAHGWTGDRSTFDDFAGFLLTDGIPNAGQVDLERGILPIDETASLLASAIQVATKTFGVDKVNIFAHSKGGLVARYAMQTVAAQTDYVITFGSPHHGTDAPNWLAWYQCSGTEQEKQQCREAADELSVARMRAYNYTSACHWELFHLPPRWVDCTANYTYAPNVRYRTIIGGSLDVGELTGTYPWEADAVPEPNTARLDGKFGYHHSDIKAKPEPYRCAISLIDQQIFPRANCENSSITRPTTIETQATASESQQTVAVVNITLPAGGNQSIPVTIDTVTRAFFTVYGAAGMNYTLLDPNGRNIDPALAATDANINYSAGAYDTTTNLWSYQYEVLSPMAGNWQQNVQSAVATPATLATFVTGDMQLTYQTEQTIYRPGDLAVIQAALYNGQTFFADASLSGVMTQPDGTQVTLSFNDNGTQGDTQAGDGVFSTQVTVAGASGYARIDLSATRGATRRELSGTIAIAAETARINRVVSEQTIDSDSDGLFDSLLLNVEVNVLQAGHFELRGSLQDGNGKLISSTAFSSLLAGTPPWAPGLHTVPLNFAGDTIRKHGVNGSYTLVQVELLDQTTQSLPVDRNSNLYTTRNYQATQFEGPLLEWIRGEDTALDRDRNGRFDELRVSIFASVVRPGNYSWNGRLVDRDGVEIGWAVGSGYLNSQLPMTFVFDGRRIGRHSRNGPYILRDVAIFQTSGGQTALVFDDQYTTNTYTYFQFEGGVGRVYLPLVRR